MGPLAIPLIMAGTSLAQSIINSRVQARNTNKTNEANRQLAEYQYSKDLEMWNRANEYNSPQAQMQRLKDAGLNPNLVYGNGAVANSTSQLPKYNAPRQDYHYVPPVDLPAMISMFQDFQVKNAQIDNLKAQKEAVDNRALNLDFQNQFLDRSMDSRVLQQLYKQWGTRSDATIKEQEIARRSEFARYAPEIYKEQARFLGLRNSSVLESMKKLNAQIDYQKLVNDWYVTRTLGGLITNGIGAVSKIPSFNQKHRK